MARDLVTHVTRGMQQWQTFEKDVNGRESHTPTRVSKLTEIFVGQGGCCPVPPQAEDIQGGPIGSGS